MNDTVNPHRPPRILFIGEMQSTHAQSWIRLLEGSGLEVHSFVMPGWLPQGGFSSSVHGVPGLRLATFLAARVPKRARKYVEALYSLYADMWVVWVLARTIRRLKPNVVHSFGLLPAAKLYDAVLPKIGYRPRWALQLRGGSDLVFNHTDARVAPHLAAIISKADVVITDNELNYHYLEQMGVQGNKQPAFGVMSGTGGVDVAGLKAQWTAPVSQRKIIVWPKAYEYIWSKGLPVLEALVSLWPLWKDYRLALLAVNPEMEPWLRALPAEIRAQMDIYTNRVPHAKVLELMLQARVVIAPSLVDGVPNSMWEAMACGAVAIVSPLETFAHRVKEGEEALFAHNLYPDQIAAQLERALTDDALVERISAKALALVSTESNREVNRPAVIAMYHELAGRAS